MTSKNLVSSEKIRNSNKTLDVEVCDKVELSLLANYAPNSGDRESLFKWDHFNGLHSITLFHFLYSHGGGGGASFSSWNKLQNRLKLNGKLFY